MRTVWPTRVPHLPPPFTEKRWHIETITNVRHYHTRPFWFVALTNHFYFGHNSINTSGDFFSVVVAPFRRLNNLLETNNVRVVSVRHFSSFSPIGLPTNLSQMSEVLLIGKQDDRYG
jgi:hypothetical protein